MNDNKDFVKISLKFIAANKFPIVKMSKGMGVPLVHIFKSQTLIASSMLYIIASGR
jgi:hypothetical protein